MRVQCSKQGKYKVRSVKRIFCRALSISNSLLKYIFKHCSVCECTLFYCATKYLFKNVSHKSLRSKNICAPFFLSIFRPDFSMELYQNGVQFSPMAKRFGVFDEFDHQWDLCHPADLHLLGLLVHGISQVSQHENVSRSK